MPDAPSTSRRRTDRAGQAEGAIASPADGRTGAEAGGVTRATWG